MFFSKKLIGLFLLSIFFHSVVSAQMKQGSLLVGGDINFSSSKGYNAVSPDQPKSSAFAISPSIALAIGSNSFAGIRLSYGHSSQDMANSVPTHETGNNFGAAFFLRQYKPLGSRFYFFVDESISGSFGKTTTSEDITPPVPDGYSKNFGLGLSVYPGVAFMATPHLQLETGIQDMFAVSYSRINYSGSGSTHSFTAGTALSQPFNNIYLGARFLFGN